MGFKPGKDESLAAKDSTLADERQMFALLWLYPDVSSLTTVLLKRLEESWDYGCAFLLEEILKLQIIYRDYLGDVDSTGSALGDGALMMPDDVRRVTRVLSLDFVDYRPDVLDSLISRELQFKVLSFCFGKELMGNCPPRLISKPCPGPGPVTHSWTSAWYSVVFRNTLR